MKDKNVPIINYYNDISTAPQTHSKAASWPHRIASGLMFEMKYIIPYRIGAHRDFLFSSWIIGQLKRPDSIIIRPA